MAQIIDRMVSYFLKENLVVNEKTVASALESLGYNHNNCDISQICDQVKIILNPIKNHKES